jgi:hypothetical protein
MYPWTPWDLHSTLWETLHWWTLFAALKKNIWHTVIYLNCMGNLPTSLFLDTEVQLHHVKHGFGHTPIFTKWHANEIEVYPCLQPNLNYALALAARMSLPDSVLHNLQRE